MKRLIIVVAILFAFKASAQTTTIAAKDADKHLNETVTVTGKIFGSKFFANSNMTLLDVDGFNPNQKLTLMISGTDRPKFKGKPEDDYKGKEVTVTGKIIDFKGKPEIVITDPDQIKID
jgi:DNA/RNA endonuclease YhcR with UshA esterase domain